MPAPPRKPVSPQPGQPLPAWTMAFSPAELHIISQHRKDKGLTGVRRWIWEAIEQRIARETFRPWRTPDIDVSNTTMAELREYVTQLQMQGIKDADAIVASPGHMWDVKGNILRNEDGTPALNVDQKIKAIAERRQGVKGVRELAGLDAPSRKRIQHTVITDKIVEYAAMLGISDDDDDDGTPLAIEQ